MKKIILNQASLKLIAMGLMLLDHIYKIFCFDVRDFLLVHTTLTQEVIQWGIQLIGMLGAASFWIFAFFIAEGCRRTHNRSAYLIRLLIMGLISEIPFQYMICILLDAPLTLHFTLTNIFFTLFMMLSEADKRFKSSPSYHCLFACLSHMSCKQTTVPLVFWRFLPAIAEVMNIVCIVWEGSSCWKPLLSLYRDKAFRQMICCMLSCISSTLLCPCRCYPAITVKKEPCQNGYSIPSIPCTSPFWLYCISLHEKTRKSYRKLSCMYRAVFYYVNSRAVIFSLFYSRSFHIGKT